MAKPNLFKFATRELSQDAFIAWLLSWADPAAREADEPLHLTGAALLSQLLERAGVDRPAEVGSVRVQMQVQKIDVLAVVNDEIAVVIEDKTHTREHSGQLERYRAAVAKHLPGLKVAAIYLKTGDQCGYQGVEQAGYACFRRPDFLAVLRRGRELGVRNAIFDDFLDHLQAVEDAVRSFRSRPLAQWDRNCYVGLYLELQGLLGEGAWKPVPNKGGGFMGFHWHRRGDRFLQLEDERLCFKVEVTDKARRATAWREWRDAVLAAGQDGLRPQPARRRLGTWMTVALLADYRVADERGGIDLSRTIAVLREAEWLMDSAAAALERLAEPPAPPATSALTATNLSP